MNEVGRRMPGEPFGFTSRSGHYIYIGVASILCAESDRLLVGREVWSCFLAGKAGEALRTSTGFRDDPQVVCIAEDDLRGADVGLAEEAGLSKRK